MSSAEVQAQGIFNVEEEPTYSFEFKEPVAVAANTLETESPSTFLDNLKAPQPPPQTQAQDVPIFTQFTETPAKPPGFMPPSSSISPSLMLSSMANSSPATENILSSAKERLNQIRPWKDFFSIDQFRIPESSTAAQSRASHNFTHFQNNYLIILLLFSAFSLLADISLLMVSAVILGGFYYISTLKPDFKINFGGQEVDAKQINFGWIAISVILLYLSSALSTVFWILSVSAVITVAHASLHDIAIENEFNSV